jgi:hypothetical protein
MREKVHQRKGTYQTLADVSLTPEKNDVSKQEGGLSESTNRHVRNFHILSEIKGGEEYTRRCIVVVGWMWLKIKIK